MIARPEPPARLTDQYADWEWEVAYEFHPTSVTFRLSGPEGSTRFLKLLPPGQYPSLQAEADRTRWAGRYLPVPKVIDCGSDGVVTWLVTEGLPGRDATDTAWRNDPERLVRALGAALRTFHLAPVEDCPFDFTLAQALPHVRRRAVRGLIHPARDFHTEFAHLSVEGALAQLERLVPREKTRVVCHGDWCAPNLLLENWAVTGYVDLGELGVADPWWDLAVGSWSVIWNYGPEYEDVFLKAYGVERDEQRIEFYRLLYDLVS